MQQEPYHHKVTRYHAPDGKRCKATDPGAVKSTTETETYYGDLLPLPPKTERASF